VNQGFPGFGGLTLNPKVCAMFFALLCATTSWTGHTLFTLPPAAQPPLFPPPKAMSIRPSPIAPEAAPPSPLDRVLLAAFRWQLQRQTGRSDRRPGFEGMLAELRDFQLQHDISTQADCSENIMKALGGPLPAIFKAVAAQRDWAPAALAVCTQPLLRFLVGDMALTQRAPGDPRPGGVLIQRCKVLEEGGCKGLCVHMCKRPTERFFSERWGLPITMSPNFQTLQCQLSFGVPPPPDEEIEAILPAGCLAGCALAAAGADRSAWSGVRAPEVEETCV